MKQFPWEIAIVASFIIFGGGLSIFGIGTSNPVQAECERLEAEALELSRTRTDVTYYAWDGDTQECKASGMMGETVATELDDDGNLIWSDLKLRVISIEEEPEELNFMSNVKCVGTASDQVVMQTYMFTTQDKAREISETLGFDGAIHMHENVMVLSGYDAEGYPMYNSVSVGYMPGSSHDEFFEWYNKECR
jgi:hypothetical protein